MTTNHRALHDLCLLANALIQARATLYAQSAALQVGPRLVCLDPETIANEAGLIYLALIGKASMPDINPKGSSTDAL